LFHFKLRIDTSKENRLPGEAGSLFSGVRPAAGDCRAGTEADGGDQL